MPKDKEQKEIVVPPPDLRYREKPLTRDTTGVEALDVSKISMRIGRYLSRFMIILGACLSFLSLYSLVTSTSFIVYNPYVLVGLGISAATNIFCGLMLLAKE